MSALISRVLRALSPVVMLVLVRSLVAERRLGLDRPAAERRSPATRRRVVDRRPPRRAVGRRRTVERRRRVPSRAATPFVPAHASAGTRRPAANEFRRVEGALDGARPADPPARPQVRPAPRPARSRPRAATAASWLRAHRLDLYVAGVVSLVLGIVHSWGLGRYPAFFDDEGTYVSQAWAVDTVNTLAPYTYWYDHPPLGWILLAGWGKVMPLFGADLHSIAAARSFMVVLFMVSACLLYAIARRLGMRRPFAALAVVLFGLSPLAIHYQRMVLLDNIALCWLLAAFLLAQSPRARLWAFAGSGICLAAACLTKETFVLFAPAVVLVAWQTAAGPTRRFALAVLGGLFALTAAFYPLFAALRGELIAGADHTSLMDGVRFQLSRPGGGSILDSDSPSRALLDSWIALDPLVLALGVVALPFGLCVRRLHPVALALVIPALVAFRPGSYLPAMFVIGLLPFAGLLAAASADHLWRPRAAREWLGDRRARRWTAVPVSAPVGSVAIVVVLAGLALVATLRWSGGLATQTGTDLNRPYREAVAWLEANADRSSTILVDNTIWTDLVERDFSAARTVWFYKLDLDPAVTMPWQEFDYVVSTNMLAGNLDRLPRSRELHSQSTLIVRFASGNETVEIRRVARDGRPTGAARALTDTARQTSGTQTTRDGGTNPG